MKSPRMRTRVGPAVTTAAALAPSLVLALALSNCAGPGSDAGRPARPPSQEAIELRNRGIAELENEKPELAEAAFLELTEKAPDDPLGYANLAIAKLRQQKFEEAGDWIARAVEKSPDDPRLWAIEGDILQWSGRPDEALAVFGRAAEAAPDDLEIQYALYRQATTISDASDEALAALDRLARLRPENLVVLLELGSQARQAGDRERATAAYLRIRELMWQSPRGGEELLAQVFEGLEAGDLAGIRAPAQRLQNVLKITPMYRESLRELATGIQGIPVLVLMGEPAASTFGEPIEVSFRGERPGEDSPGVLDLALGDFDGDQRPDVAVLSASEPPTLELRATGGATLTTTTAPPGIERILVTDLDNDGHQDVLGYGAGGLELWRGDGAGGLARGTEETGLSGAEATGAATMIDFDIEGDLDLFAAGGGPSSSESPRLYRNALLGPLEPVGDWSLPDLTLGAAHDTLSSDLDRDGDLDLLIAHDGGLTLLNNLRQGRFEDSTEVAGLAGSVAGSIHGTIGRIVSADLDNDGLPEIITTGDRVRVYQNRGGRFESRELEHPETSGAGPIEIFDADNDGRLDLALGVPGGIAILGLGAAGQPARSIPVEQGPASVTALSAADLDGDGDLDLVTGGADGIHHLINEGGNANGWLAVRLRGLDTGNSKNNFYGIGSTLEVRAGNAYQFREATGGVTHFGLGSVETADLLRVVWTNGVPQNRISPTARQTVVEEQLLKGSCPFLYTWTGERFEFATDLLWGAPAGLPMGIDKWMPSDPEELIEIERIAPRDGSYEIRITEELWEAAFLDFVRLWVVDHPADVEVASTMKILPGSVVPEGVLGTRGLRPVAAAWDAADRDVTARVKERDGVYADGWRPSRYQGVPREPWSFTFDLGATPAGPVRLHLDGWIFPTDASLNIALDQGQQIPLFPPRLEVETTRGWQVLVGNIGFPAGKTKTMVVDVPALPAGARRLRIVASQWLSWDRIVWAPADTSVADDEPTVRAKLEPTRAELGFRGFSRLVRVAPNAPHEFDYSAVSTVSPWLPFPGRYTRYGDVLELLLDPDDRSVILGAGDEMAVVFDAAQLDPVREGWRRTLFLESHGWDKDADRNTFEPQQVEPLPFRSMAAYGEPFPDTPLHRAYAEEWLTRVVEPPEPGRLPGQSPGQPPKRPIIAQRGN